MILKISLNSIYNIINKVWSSLLSINSKTFVFYRKKMGNYLEGIEKVRTFATAFAQKHGQGTEERVL